ncbi:MAG: hypothetical protein HY726_14205 [Candidatus Rokubacteria bacterium]|nr:hypothetical protein [Candidatus Rokubacteria bacterium]
MVGGGGLGRVLRPRTNSVLNILVLSGLMLFLIELPREIVFGRIIPAVGLSLIVGKLTRQEPAS